MSSFWFLLCCFTFRIIKIRDDLNESLSGLLFRFLWGVRDVGVCARKKRLIGISFLVWWYLGRIVVDDE